MTSGPSLLLVATGQPVRGVPAAALLRDLKGPADPHRCSPDHLRARLGSANMFNNLVHTSDGPAEVVRELAVILKDDELSRLWQCVFGARPGRMAQGLDHELAVTGPSVPGGISLAHMAISLRTRLLNTMRPILSDGRSRLDEIDGLLAAETDWMEGQDPARPVHSLTAYRARFVPVLRRLDAVLDIPRS